MPALALAQKVLGKAEKVGVTVPVDRVERLPDAAGTASPATEAELGATLVLHSATKYLGGHGDVMGGVVAADQAWVERLRQALVG